MGTECDKVAERYEKRKSSGQVKKNLQSHVFNSFVYREREKKYLQILKAHFGSLEGIRIMEVGAGAGGNIEFFLQCGIKPSNICASELLGDRVKELKERYPLIRIYSGDSTQLDTAECGMFDVVFQSTVFTSLLDDRFRARMADKMWELLKPGGIILWYDFMFDNPANKDVRAVKKDEVLRLFHDGRNIKFFRVTLAPPIGRIVGKLYPLFNLLPFLRTHLVALIEKK